MPSTLSHAIAFHSYHKIDRRGSKNGRHKLDEFDVKEIRENFNPKLITMTQLAKDYNVSVPTISKVINKKYWSHV